MLLQTWVKCDFLYISVCANIDAEWITRARYVFSDAFAVPGFMAKVFSVLFSSFLILWEGKAWYQTKHTAPLYMIGMSVLLVCPVKMGWHSCLLCDGWLISLFAPWWRVGLLVCPVMLGLLPSVSCYCWLLILFSIWWLFGLSDCNMMLSWPFDDGLVIMCNLVWWVGLHVCSLFVCFPACVPWDGI